MFENFGFITGVFIGVVVGLVLSSILTSGKTGDLLSVNSVLRSKVETLRAALALANARLEKMTRERGLK